MPIKILSLCKTGPNSPFQRDDFQKNMNNQLGNVLFFKEWSKMEMPKIVFKTFALNIQSENSFTQNELLFVWECLKLYQTIIWFKNAYKELIFYYIE